MEFRGKIYVYLILVASVLKFAQSERDKCSESKEFYENVVLPQMSQTQDTGDRHSVCGTNPGCCSPQMLGHLGTYSKQDVEKKVNKKGNLVKNQFETSHREMNEYFKELIQNAKSSLHKLFNSTYGDLYTENSKVFLELFDDLMLYYEGAVVDINDIFDRFFTRLMQQVFKLLQPSYDIDDNYMQCIADNINTIQPFADLPQKMSTQVRRAFIAARTFIQGLKKAEQVVGRISKIQATTQCTESFMNMSYCQVCHGHSEIKPCRSVCLSVMGQCLAALGETSFNNAWNIYIESNLKLLNRLKGPFNMESVLDPIDVKISEAVMTLQDNRIHITDTVIHKCGYMAQKKNMTSLMFNFNLNGGMKGLGHIPGLSNIGLGKLPNQMSGGLGISKRSVDESEEEKSESGKDEKRKRKRNRKRRRRRRRRREQVERKKILNVKHFRSTLMSGPGPMEPPMQQTKLEMLVQKMVAITNEAKNFWNNLPKAVCAEESEKDEDKQCWDGERPTRQTHEAIEHGLKTQPNNEELNVNPPKPKSIAIRQEIAILHEIAANLDHAVLGVDPVLVDSDDTMDIPASPTSAMAIKEEISTFQDDFADEERSGEGSGYDAKSNDNKNMPFSLDEMRGGYFRDLARWQKKLVEQVLGETIAPETTLAELTKRLDEKPDLGTNEEKQSEDTTEKPKKNRKETKKKFRDLTKSEQAEIEKKLGRIVKPGTSLDDIELELNNKKNELDQKKERNGLAVTKPTVVLSTTSGTTRNKSTALILLVVTFFSYLCWTNNDYIV